MRRHEVSAKLRKDGESVSPTTSPIPALVNDVSCRVRLARDESLSERVRFPAGWRDEPLANETVEVGIPWILLQTLDPRDGHAALDDLDPDAAFDEPQVFAQSVLELGDGDASHTG